LQKEHPLLLANFFELATALTVNPLLDQLPITALRTSTRFYF